MVISLNLSQVSDQGLYTFDVSFGVILNESWHVEMDLI